METGSTVQLQHIEQVTDPCVRYFYRHTSGPGIHPIDPHCLNEIKTRKLGDIICENTDIAELAENVFSLVRLRELVNH